MRVLLDGNLPRQLGPRIAEPAGYVVHTIHQRRWSDLSDGALLDAAAGAYDAFVTLDRDLVHQQNLAARPFAIVVLRARTNRRPTWSHFCRRSSKHSRSFGRERSAWWAPNVLLQLTGE